jgi:tetratricopeptide (TPR) repeat protein
MRLSLLLYIALFFCTPVWGQKKLENTIPNDARRKVEHARKLFNQLKIFDGERVLKELIKEHPNDCYYRNALLQMQRQVLRLVSYSQGQVEWKSGDSLPAMLDSLDLEEDTLHDARPSNTVSNADNVEEGIGIGGLDRGPSSSKKKPMESQSDAPLLSEAVMTIDSNLLKPELDADGDTVRKRTKKEKALQRQMKALNDLAQIPYEGYKQDFLLNARRATLDLFCNDSASGYLREFMVDTLNPDWGIPEEVTELFEDGLFQLRQRNYPAAAKLLEQAVANHPEYFHARMRLADTYFFLNKDSSARKLLRQVIQDYPLRPEPFVRIAEHFYEVGRYEDGIAALIDAICIYPQQNYFARIHDMALKLGYTFDDHWIRREVFPLTTSKNYEELIAVEKTPWWQYQSVKQDVFSYYDTLGKVRPNDKTTERYLEIYAWKKMLERTGKDKFPFARAMDKIDYLDCYVFITLFHQDIYTQFADFAKFNKERIKKYFFLWMNWESKKFDKLRLEFFPPPPKKEETKPKEPPKK